MIPSPLHRIELFLDSGCSSTAEVQHAVREAGRRHLLEVHTYFRDRHHEEFLRRAVFICPAIFINGTLAFYGPVSSVEITTFLRTRDSLRRLENPTGSAAS